MRTISKLGITMGIVIAAFTVWRWTVVYDSPFRTVVGLFLAVSVMGWAYVIEWMTGKDKSDEDLHKKIDSLAQEFKGLKELNNLK